MAPAATSGAEMFDSISFDPDSFDPLAWLFGEDEEKEKVPDSIKWGILGNVTPMPLPDYLKRKKRLRNQALLLALLD